MKKLLLVLFAAVAVFQAVRWARGDSPLSLATVEIRNPHAPSSPLYPASQRFVDAINADPRLKARFSGVFTRRGIYSEVTTALRRGAKSLDAPLVVGATTAFARTLPYLDTHSCAETFRDRDTFDEALSAKMRAAMEQVSPVHHGRLMEFYLQALKAEVDDVPIRPLDQDALDNALRNLGSQYQGDYAARFAATMGNRQGAADEDLCWAGKTLLHGVTLMGERDRAVLSRWAIAGG